MSGTVEIRDDDVAPYSEDPEKNPKAFGTSEETQENWGDQIPHEMLEVLAPNGEGEHILNIINNMTEEEAYAIIEESVKFHAE